MTSWEQRMSERARARAAVEDRAAEDRFRREVAAEHEARKAHARAVMPSPRREGVCGHGIVYGRGGLTPLFEAGCAWAGGVGFCECCRSHFGYIAEAVFTARSSWSWTPDDTLCTDCGGVPFEEGENPWQVVEVSEASTPDQVELFAEPMRAEHVWVGPKEPYDQVYINGHLVYDSRPPLDPCGGSVRGGRGCSCDPPFGEWECVCGHPRGSHEHYRPGSDCALCDCATFRRRRPWTTKSTPPR